MDEIQAQKDLAEFEKKVYAMARLDNPKKVNFTSEQLNPYRDALRGKATVLSAMTNSVDTPVESAKVEEKTEPVVEKKRRGRPPRR